MSEYFTVLVLGLVQGLAEFLPVSSSGHLRLFESFLKPVEGVSALTLEVLLHGGTLLAVFIWLRSDIKDFILGFFDALKQLVGRKLGTKAVSRRLLFLYIFVGSIPTAIIGILLKMAGVEHLGVKAVAGFLVVTGCINFFVRRKGDEEPQGSMVEGMTYGKAIFIGICQGIAVLPGISRSGSTIAAGYYCGLPVERAARFSFLLSVPAIGGATFLTLLDIFKTGGEGALNGLTVILAGSLLAFVVGLLALSWLFAALDKGKFHLFAYYCWIIAALVFYFAR
jgi:undecaprenyl-diphosphatase